MPRKSLRPSLTCSLLNDCHHSYINFANGDEELEVVYGSSLPRLQSLKKQYDAANVFKHWFPLTPRQQTASS